MPFLEKLKELVLYSDLFYYKPSSGLHFEGNRRIRSYLGGIFSILMWILIGAIFINAATPIFEKQDPYTTHT